LERAANFVPRSGETNNMHGFIVYGQIDGPTLRDDFFGDARVRWSRVDQDFVARFRRERGSDATCELLLARLRITTAGSLE